jgi:putative ABC transport system permease protein
VDIKAQILQESIVLTLIAGLAGIAFSAGMIYLINILDSVGPVSNFCKPWTLKVVVALMVLIVAGLLAGVYSFLRATKMKPVDALRTE